MRKGFFIMTVMAVFSLTVTTITAQTNPKFTEFPVAVGPDSTFSAGAVYGGASGIVAILGDTLSQYNITAQLVYPPDSLIGNRISVGRQGTFPGPLVAFDGTNYLLVWREFSGDVNGQFISTSGNLVGTYFTIGTSASSCDLAFGDTTYFVVFVKTDGHLYGQRVGKSGSLIGSQVQISNNQAREASLAYDSTNYLIAWVENSSDKDIYGQFVSKTGLLVGNNFLIDGGPYFSDNPISLAFDGIRFLLAFHEAPDYDSSWTLYGRFITTTGTIEETISICDSTKAPFIPFVAFDGNNYLITWTQMSDMKLMGRVWTPSGVPIGEPFVVFDSLNGKTPIGGLAFAGDYFLVVGTRIDSNFTDGDVYGRFIPQTGIEEENIQWPGSVFRIQNYPNPFNASTSIRYTLPISAHIELTIYNIQGQLVRTLLRGEESPGTYIVTWDGRDDIDRNVSSGVYFYQLKIPGGIQKTRKMLFLR